MSDRFTDQILALAGMVQSAILVDELARNGSVSPEELQTAVQAVVNLEPDSVEDIYGGVSALHTGFIGLKKLLGREPSGIHQEVVRYVMSMIHIESKMRNRHELLDKLTSGLERAKGQSEYFSDPIHDSVVGSLASAYVDSVSQLNFRIQVTGNPTLLQDERMAGRIRTLLLFGVRSAFLWQQKGGRRWHFLFFRKKIRKAAQEIQTRGLH